MLKKTPRFRRNAHEERFMLADDSFPFYLAVQEDGTLLLEDAEIFERQTLEQVLKEKGGAD